MQIIINIPNKQLFEKILSLLSVFKSDGVEILTDNQNKQSQPHKNKNVEILSQIIDMKSPDSISVDEKTILDPHRELSRDIS